MSRINQNKPVMKTCRYERKMDVLRCEEIRKTREQLHMHFSWLMASKSDPTFTAEEERAIVIKMIQLRDKIRRLKPFMAKFPFNRFHRQFGHMRKAYAAQQRVMRKHGGKDIMDIFLGGYRDG